MAYSKSYIHVCCSYYYYYDYINDTRSSQYCTRMVLKWSVQQLGPSELSQAVPLDVQCYSPMLSVALMFQLISCLERIANGHGGEDMGLLCPPCPLELVQGLGGAWGLSRHAARHEWSQGGSHKVLGTLDQCHSTLFPA